MTKFHDQSTLHKSSQKRRMSNVECRSIKRSKTSNSPTPSISEDSEEEQTPVKAIKGDRELVLDLTADSDSESDTNSEAQEELELLDLNVCDSSIRCGSHELCTAPIVTRTAYLDIGRGKVVRQYGVLGSVLEIGLESFLAQELLTDVHRSKDRIETPRDPRLYLNTNAPLSAVICGVQGSGKSHTVSVMLENMLVSNCKQIGTLVMPLAGLVLHYGEGGPDARPSEAAYVGIPKLKGISVPRVRIYVPKSSLNTMKHVYAPLGENIKVKPLLLEEHELDAEAFLTMMAVGSLDTAPLYMQIVLSLLRDLGENFTISNFRKELKERKGSFNPAQLAGLEQRMTLLNAFLATSTTSSPRFSSGQLTIIDLSDPFIDPASACSLFEIIVRLFIRVDVKTGKVLLVDEAHKYLSVGRGSAGLAKSLLTLVREQRHLAMRVLISTQEPTVIPSVMLELCTLIILHRFSSPNWWEHIMRHVSAQLACESNFDKIVRLQTGEAMVLSPSGLAMLGNGMTLCQLGRSHIIAKSRKRITADGGTSVLAVDSKFL
ncbi:hypothetical protein AMATHDRAFT_1931 [Amanita thiersii Skay4041]|uniref:Zona occludens toxin N-terminal domain-containing protein n=1 Tax=Amanita thiersii Skay4041 TaxID=703135 RepID=A0A2A9NT58_9AGAR|nr:hypothetical protein AMATHDRAFT_1931 [Amanita thiersii Skay4041]